MQTALHLLVHQITDTKWSVYMRNISFRKYIILYFWEKSYDKFTKMFYVLQIYISIKIIIEKKNKYCKYMNKV